LRDAGKPLVLASGLKFAVDPVDPLRLGAKNGSGDSHNVSFSVHGDASARLFVILGTDAFATLQNEHPADLGVLLRDHTVLTGVDALIVLAAGGGAGADFAAKVLNSGGVSVGVSFSAGAGVDWMVCRAAHDSDGLLKAIREVFVGARLPQSAL